MTCQGFVIFGLRVRLNLALEVIGNSGQGLCQGNGGRGRIVIQPPRSMKQI